MAVLASCAFSDKENVPPPPATASRCPVAHGIAVLKNQRMKRPGGGGGGGKPRRRVPLRDITNLVYLAALPPPPVAVYTEAAGWREEPAAAREGVAAEVRGKLRKEFR
uniref:Uncharacterized protein n=1 Tax=Leersia perrieri TaxID=77586 RepID=A0A0D9VUI1_9ORYZ